MLSGAVQALVVRDLLDTATAHRLLGAGVAGWPAGRPAAFSGRALGR